MEKVAKNEKKAIQYLAERMAVLYGRWQEEKDYEDFEEYIKYMKKATKAVGCVFVELKKSPFQLQVGVNGVVKYIKATKFQVGYGTMLDANTNKPLAVKCSNTGDDVVTDECAE